MMRRTTFLGRTLLLAGLLTTCGACSRTIEVQVIPYPWVAQLRPKSADCTVPIYREGDSVPKTCSDVGDVFVGDTGYTTGCGLDRMLDEVRVQTCLYGADAAQVMRMQEPSFFGSSCYEIRARFLKCPASSS